MNFILEIKNLRKSFGDIEVLKGIDLSIEEGEFITILGASGCGKTTTLRIIAGLEQADEGSVFLEGVDVSALVPNKRNLHTVFQSYALFPHMNVFENISYSQRLKKVSKAEQEKKVMEALELVRLTGFEERMPNQLSGGQSQRVAIARAVINEPKVLLLDEPLGALDLRLRQAMQRELKQLQQQIGITFVYITHDQEEALNMSDRIVVMREGKFEQIGTPMEVYNRPKTSFVADFIESANIITGDIMEVKEDMVIFQNENGVGRVKRLENQVLPKDKVTVAIRGENLFWYCEEANGPYFDGKVVDKTFAGGSIKVAVALKDGSILYSNQHDVECPMEIGENVQIYWAPEKAVLIDL